MLGIHMGLKPVLVAEYSEQFELLVVEIQVANISIRIITGYGPNEIWEDKERLPFYIALEKEVASPELEGKSILIAMNANAKLGEKYIPNDPKSMTKNGKVLADILNRHALVVVNGIKDRCTGLITRERITINGAEKSVIDFVIASHDIIKHLDYIHIDDQRVHVLTRNRKTKTGVDISKSDHNIIETKFNIEWNSKEAKVIEVFKFKDAAAKKKFKEDTTETSELS